MSVTYTNIIGIVLLLLFSFNSWGQKEVEREEREESLDTSIVKIQEFDEIIIPKNFNAQYRYYLSRVRRVYPLAIHAADLIDSLDYELGAIDKKRKQRRVARKTQKELKEDFKFVIKDLYVSEGKVLTKLIHRETGLTVRDIIKKYKSGFEAYMYDGMAKIFEQDLDAVYDPTGEDFVMECVVQDLLNGVVEFDSSFQTMSRTEFRDSKKKSKEVKKETKKKIKLFKKKKKKAKKEKQKALRKQKREN